ncbi:hypothetical protein [Microvirga guangxiensis]|nr:hypothetical protein [Microvirga guangxiensis]
MITLACNAATSLAASAGTSPELTLVDLRLTWAALGWLAVLATDDGFVPLSDHPRPERLHSSVDTALWHGRAMARFLVREAPPKVLLPQNRRGDAIQHADVAKRKQSLIRRPVAFWRRSWWPTGSI